MGLLNPDLEQLIAQQGEYQRSALANYQPQQEQESGVLDRIMPFIPGIGAFYLAGKEYQNQQEDMRRAARDMQGMDYNQLAQYWAQRGDAQKAQQYAELAQAQSGAARTSLAPQIGVNPETQQPEYFVMQEGGVPRFTGVVPQQKPTPVSQQRVAAPRLPTGMMWDAEAGRAVPVPGIPQKAATPSAAPASPGKAPTGFRFTPEGNLQPIPGGPKDDSQQRKAANDMIGQTIATLDRLSKIPALPRAVGLASRVPSIPGGEAANFEATLETLKSQTFLPMIQSMRGMGALTDKEGQVLMQAVGELNTRQSPEAFRASLSRIKQSLEAKRTGEKSALEKAREELARRKGGM